jgi:hypothetical protein
MEAVGTPEKSVCFNGTTRRYIPQDSHLYAHAISANTICKFMSDLNILNCLPAHKNQPVRSCVLSKYSSFWANDKIKKNTHEVTPCRNPASGTFLGTVFTKDLITLRWTPEASFVK